MSTLADTDSEVYNIPKSKGKNTGEHQFAVGLGDGGGVWKEMCHKVGTT